MKIAPIIHALKIRQTAKSFGEISWLIYTGQHYDNRMSDVFFKEFDIPQVGQFPECRLSQPCGTNGKDDGRI